MKSIRDVSRFGACTFGLMLLAAPVGAAELGEWDTNADTRLNNSEFRTGFEKAGVYKAWDKDGNNGLSESEFKAGIGGNSSAFNSRFGEDAFGRWDVNRDRALSDDEFYNGVYASYDRDGDKVIEEPEFSDLGDDMGDNGFWDV